ncbi:MAG: hypothetical protein IJ037_10235 [Clostridia bacterium]|nr:hypothetical protein [Clostridia bacterium]
MFDNKQIEQFRQIKAPSELKSRVLASKPVRTTAPMVRYAALAASVVLILTVTLLLFPRGTDIAVTTNGERITSSGIMLAENPAEPVSAYALARTTSASLDVPLNFTAEGECRITVSSGDLTVENESILPGETFTSDGEPDVIWHIANPDPETVYTLVLHTENGQTILVMKYDGGWSIRLNEN